jgi:hypothetical protein
MLERRGNRAFVRSLFEENERVILDYSHAVDLPPLVFAMLLLRQSTSFQLIVGIGAVLTIAGWVRNPDWWGWIASHIRRDRTGAPNDDTPIASESVMIEYMAERHPDWDRERVERVVQAVRERR